ncbi:hypothetical protein BH11BAC6_BH11BAC6_05230 [soil metagenome]
MMLSVALLLVSYTWAQTAEEIATKHIQAIGGKDLVSQVSSVYTEGTVEIMGGSSPSIVTILNGKGFKNELDFNGSKIVRCITDKGGWMINPMMGAPEAQAISTEDFNAEKEAIYTGGPLYNYAEKGSKIELLPNQKTGDINTYIIKLITDVGVEYTFSIDPSTYYILKTEKVSGGNLTTYIFSDYRKTDLGFVMPYAAEITLPQGFTINTTVSKVEINKAVDPVIFEMPK